MSRADGAPSGGRHRSSSPGGPRRVWALARYAAESNLRTPYTWVGAVGFVALALFGVWTSARSGRGWIQDPSMIFNGAILAAVLGVRSGLIPQRTTGLQTYLRFNFVTPTEHLGGAILSLVGSWLSVGAGVFMLTLVLPGGGLETAAWNAMVFALRTGALLPFVLMTESLTAIDIPFFMPAFGFLLLLMILVFSLGEVEAVGALAPPMEPFDYGSTRPALVRAAGVMVIGFGIALLAAYARGRPRQAQAKPPPPAP